MSQIDVNSGGYQAEYGGAMGGVINTVLKSGTNELHGSAFGYWSPYWLAGDPKVVLPWAARWAASASPTTTPASASRSGGPLIKDKLFFWVGFAPRISDTHVLRQTYSASARRDAGSPHRRGRHIRHRSEQLALDGADPTSRTGRTTTAATLDWVPLPDNRLTVAIVGTPEFNTQLKNQFGVEQFISDPRTAHGVADQGQQRRHGPLGVQAVRAQVADRRAGRACTTSTSTTARRTPTSTT